MPAAPLSKVIERAIRRSTGATKIIDFDLVQPVWGGNGEVLRVELQGAEVDCVIVKHITLPAGVKRKKKLKDASLARTLTSYDNELTFYQHPSQLLPAQVRIPRFYSGQRLDDGWIFVLEDLVESGFTAARKSYSKSDIQGTLNWLAGFHAAFLGSPGEGLWKAGSYWNLKDREGERSKMSHPKLKQIATSLDDALNRCKHKTLIHGDAKVDNFCFPILNEGKGASNDDVVEKVAGLDFQYTGLGCGMKDVMCLLDSSLTPFEASISAAGYLDYYFLSLTAALNKRDPCIDAAAIEEEWRQLYPLAWADYYRFLDGWAPGKYPPEGYSEEMLSQALSYLANQP